MPPRPIAFRRDKLRQEGPGAKARTRSPTSAAAATLPAGRILKVGRHCLFPVEIAVAAGRQRQKRDVVGQVEIVDDMSTGAIEDEHRMRIRGDLPADPGANSLRYWPLAEPGRRWRRAGFCAKGRAMLAMYERPISNTCCCRPLATVALSASTCSTACSMIGLRK